PMPAPSARATTRHRQAEHTVVRTVSVTAPATAGQVTARTPSRNGPAPTCRQRNHSTVPPPARRSNAGPNRRRAGGRAAGPAPAETARTGATTNTRASRAHSSAVRLPQRRRTPLVAVNRYDRGPVLSLERRHAVLGTEARCVRLSLRTKIRWKLRTLKVNLPTETCIAQYCVRRSWESSQRPPCLASCPPQPVSPSPAGSPGWPPVRRRAG